MFDIGCVQRQIRTKVGEDGCHVTRVWEAVAHVIRAKEVNSSDGESSTEKWGFVATEDKGRRIVVLRDISRKMSRINKLHDFDFEVEFRAFSTFLELLSGATANKTVSPAITFCVSMIATLHWNTTSWPPSPLLGTAVGDVLTVRRVSPMYEYMC